MKKYFKSKTMLMSLISLSAILTSCKGGAVTNTADVGRSDADETSWKDKGGTITVTWWNNYVNPNTDGSNLSEEEARAKTKYNEYFFASDVIKEFEKIHTNIKIDMQYKGSYNDIASEIKQGISSGNYPTLASGYPDNVAVYEESGIVADVQSLIDDKQWGFGKRGKAEATYTNQDADSLYEDDENATKADFSESFLTIEKGMYNGHLYSMPYSKSSEALYVNQDILDKEGEGEVGTSTTNYTAPKASASKTKYTLDANNDGTISFFELIEIGRKAKADFPDTFSKKDSKGYYTSCPIVWDSYENLFITACEAMNIPYLNANGNGLSEQVVFNNDDAKKVVKKLKEFYDEGIFCTKNQLYYTDETKGYHAYPTGMLQSGNAVAIISSTAGARYVADEGYTATIQEIPSFSRKEFGLDNDETLRLKAISQGPSICFFRNEDPRVPRAAFEFYKYLTNSTNSLNLAKKTSYFPLRISSSNKIVKDYADVTAKADVYTRKMLELNNTYTSKSCNFMTQVFSYSAKARTAVGNLITTVFSGTDVDTAFDTAYSNVVK